MEAQRRFQRRERVTGALLRSWSRASIKKKVALGRNNQRDHVRGSLVLGKTEGAGLVPRL